MYCKWCWCGVFMCCYVPIVYEYAIAAVAVASDESVFSLQGGRR